MFSVCQFYTQKINEVGELVDCEVCVFIKSLLFGGIDFRGGGILLYKILYFFTLIQGAFLLFERKRRFLLGYSSMELIPCQYQNVNIRVLVEI